MHHGLAEPSEPHSSNPSEERWVRQEQEYDATLLSQHQPTTRTTSLHLAADSAKQVRTS